MAWIESHQSLGSHPKTKRLTRLLGCSRAATVGHLHFLWWWALDHAQDGDLSGFDIEEIADEAKWEGDAGDFVNGLQNCGIKGAPGFLDATMCLHDWHDYAGKLIDKRRSDAERKRVLRTSRGRTPDAPPDGAGNRTVPNRTEPKEPSPAPQDDTEGFEAFWKTYPKRNNKKLGRDKAEERFRRLNTKERADVQVAVVHYRNACDAGLTLAKDAFRWLRDACWSDWMTPATPDRKPSDPKTAPAPYGKTPERCPHGISNGLRGLPWCADCETKEEMSA